jgi:hypothetical protein
MLQVVETAGSVEEADLIAQRLVARQAIGVSASACSRACLVSNAGAKSPGDETPELRGMKMTLEGCCSGPAGRVG